MNHLKIIAAFQLLLFVNIFAAFLSLYLPLSFLSMLSFLNTPIILSQGSITISISLLFFLGFIPYLYLSVVLLTHKETPFQQQLQWFAILMLVNLVVISFFSSLLIYILPLSISLQVMMVNLFALLQLLLYILLAVIAYRLVPQTPMEQQSRRLFFWTVIFIPASFLLQSFFISLFVISLTSGGSNPTIYFNTIAIIIRTLIVFLLVYATHLAIHSKPQEMANFALQYPQQPLQVSKP